MKKLLAVLVLAILAIAVKSEARCSGLGLRPCGGQASDSCQRHLGGEPRTEIFFCCGYQTDKDGTYTGLNSERAGGFTPDVCEGMLRRLQRSISLKHRERDQERENRRGNLGLLHQEVDRQLDKKEHDLNHPKDDSPESAPSKGRPALVRVRNTTLECVQINGAPYEPGYGPTEKVDRASIMLASLTDSKCAELGLVRDPDAPNRVNVVCATTERK